MNNRFCKLLLPLALLLTACGAHPTETLDLSGEWQFTTDPTAWDGTIRLPGSMTSNGLGDDVGVTTAWTGSIIDTSYFTDEAYAPYRQEGNIKVPFWLQPVKYYAGEAWYRREVEIPASWAERQVELFLERCHWQTRLWIDGEEIGMRNSLATPHRYDLSGRLTPGRHTLTLCVDNRVGEIDPGENSHSISDHTQGNWNGIVGAIRLEARPLVHIARTTIFPDVQRRCVRVVNLLANGRATETRARLTVETGGQRVTREVLLRPGDNQTESLIELGDDMRLWDEFSPYLYDLRITLEVPEARTTDRHAERFGMRELKAEGRRLTINGRPLFLRGTLDCAVFPKTGYPPTDRASWLKIFTTCREFGLNHIRFHSWCPPEAAFDAADQLGLYLEVECSSWANNSTTLGDGRPIDRFVAEEAEAIVRAYGNHPSFCMMMYGNEPAGHFTGYLTEWVSGWKARDGRRLYSSAGGWPNLEVNDFLSDPAPRIQGWGAGLGSPINAQRPRSDYDWSDYTERYAQPVVSHEIGQWCAYPNFGEMAKYDGVMHPKNFEIFRETLEKNGMGDLAESFLTASGKLQALCYKADIEAALRTKDFGGFQLLGLSDFPGQGTALVGVLDAFWEEKGYITADQYRRFCNATVPLVRLDRFVFGSDERLTATAEVAHYGPAPLRDTEASWRLTDDGGHLYGSGSWHLEEIPLGNCIPLGKIELPLDGVTAPVRLRLEVRVADAANDWNIWVYPPSSTATDRQPLMVDRLDAAALGALDRSEPVLLSLRRGMLTDEMGGDIAIGFSSIFWNTAWTLGQAPHTLGILCDPHHPALGLFPTDCHSDYQWWDAMSHSGAIRYAELSPEIRPLVRVIDDWFTNRPLALLFEVAVGKGRLLVSGVDFWQDMEHRPEARQLLRSLTEYMNGPDFRPEVQVDAERIGRLTRTGNL